MKSICDFIIFFWAWGKNRAQRGIAWAWPRVQRTGGRLRDTINRAFFRSRRLWPFRVLWKKIGDEGRARTALTYHLASMLLAILSGFAAMRLLAIGAVPISVERAGTGLIIGSASLLLTLSSRNASISGIIRGLCRESQECHSSPASSRGANARFKDIEEQMELLMKRYTLSLAGLIAGFVCLPLVILAAVVAEASAQSPAVLPILSLATFAFVFGIVSTIAELGKSRETLTMETVSTTAAARRNLRQPDTTATNSATHFNAIFHEIWYREGLGLPASHRPAETEWLSFRYFGLHQEEYIFFKSRLLPLDIYARWLDHLRSDLRSDAVAGCRRPDLRQAFAVFLDNEGDTEFSKVLRSVIIGEEDGSFRDIGEILA